mmetsp:Transcript_6910/g.12235  ORF Transcript_6910/g.12235 Transcript_6910/m.12235 type:complete len:234 (-) Transcript_6910:6-707(-)
MSGLTPTAFAVGPAAAGLALPSLARPRPRQHRVQHLSHGGQESCDWGWTGHLAATFACAAVAHAARTAVRSRGCSREAKTRMSFFKKLAGWAAGPKEAAEEPGSPLDSGAFSQLFEQEAKVANGECLVISSYSAIGQLFAGEYVEQVFKVNDRVVYRKLAAPAGQCVYLLFNEAGQWTLTPHMDGRPDGWAFAEDAAVDPGDIKGDFQLWTGTSWVADPTLKVQGPGASAGTL